LGYKNEQKESKYEQASRINKITSFGNRTQEDNKNVKDGANSDKLIQVEVCQ